MKGLEKEAMARKKHLQILFLKNNKSRTCKELSNSAIRKHTNSLKNGRKS
jgi:hypothetical protein